jgi:hypothetical protein
MASQVHSYFKMVHEKLQDSTLENILEVDQIIGDFEIKDPDLVKVFGILNGGRYAIDDSVTAADKKTSERNRIYHCWRYW